MIDFLIVGTFKGASSTMAFELGEHPNISIPKPKDPYFYLSELDADLTGPKDFIRAHRDSSVLDRASFDALFPNDNGATLKGEATPLYLYCHDYAIPAIQADNPQARIVIILRNPVERAFSNYNHNVKDGFETRSFAECIDSWENTEVFPLHPFFHYVRAGFYNAQVAAWQAAFTDVKIVNYEKVVTDLHLVLNEIANFLEIPSDFKPGEEIIRLNKSGKPRYPALHRFMMQENLIKMLLRPFYRAVLRNPQMRMRVAERVKNFNIESQVIDAADRARLNAIFRDDISLLSRRPGCGFVKTWQS